MINNEQKLHMALEIAKGLASSSIEGANSRGIALSAWFIVTDLVALADGCVPNPEALEARFKEIHG